MDYEDDDERADNQNDAIMLFVVVICMVIVVALSMFSSDQVDYRKQQCATVNSTALNMATTEYCTR